MEALVFRAPGEWGLQSLPVPEIRKDDDVLLKVDAASICGTDLHILSVPPGHPATPGSILGHEYTATVVDAGAAVHHLKPDDHVVIDPNVTCGLCEYCRLGMSNMCVNMTTLGIFIHGGLAEFNVAPARALHKISAEVPPHRATLAEPLSCVFNALEKAPLTPGESVAIYGGGPIGLFFLMLYKASGAGKTFIVEPVEFRRQVAKDIGATTVIDPRSENAAGMIKGATGIGADIVVDATGSSLVECLDAVRRGGRVVLFGMNQHATGLVKQNEITRYEITIIGSFIQRTAFPKVVRMLESNLLPLDKLITHRLKLAQVGEGLDAMRAGKTVKVVVTP
jgi:threonine dehydrogenase-like Zn-dependent dehydrogenase